MNSLLKVLCITLLVIGLAGAVTVGSASNVIAQANVQSTDSCQKEFGCFEVGIPFSTITKGVSITDWITTNKDAPIRTFIDAILVLMTGLIVAVGLIMIVVGGYIYMMAGGDQSKIATAKTYITSALLGIILALTGWLLLSTISTQFTSDRQEPKKPASSSTPSPTS